MGPTSQLGHYTVLSALGKGGMGEVWRARDTKLGREVAIKTLPPEFARDSERITRFEREARMLASLNHPNIAAIHGFEEDNGTYFLVLELVEGETLAERLERGSVSIEDSLRLALQIASALEAAHKSGVIHRDLKPANIKVTPSGKLKVLDFGLAKAAATTAANINMSNSPTLSQLATEKGVILGTAAYMSPEQARGREVDNRTDIWAFGCVLYEMLTAKALFASADVSLTLARVLERAPDFSLLPAGLDSRIQDLLERCLEKDQENRLHDIADARIEIQRVLSNPQQRSAESAAVPTANRRSFLGTAATGAVAAIVAGSLGWKLKPNAISPVNRFSQVLPEGQEFTSTFGSLLAVSRDARLLVYVAHAQLYLRTMDSLDLHAIPGTTDTVGTPFFSPDGRQIGYFCAGQLFRIAIGGGAPIAIAPSTFPFEAPSWGEDDNIVWGQTSGIMRVSAKGGTPQKLVDAGGNNLARPQALPGGETVLFAVGGPSGGIAVQSLKSGQRKILFPGTSPSYIPTGHLVYEQDGSLLGVQFDARKLEVSGNPVTLVNGVRNGPAQYVVSDSGTLAYIPRMSDALALNRVLSWVDLKTGIKTPLPLPPKPYRHPRLSPDGTRIAIQTTDARGQSDIWIYYLDGKTQLQQLAGKGSNSRPIWTRDSKHLTFTSNQDGTDSIWWQPADGSAPPEQLTHAEAGLPHWPDSWSPDGAILAFTKYRQGEQHIWTLSKDQKSEPKMIVGGTGAMQAGGADFSPNGQWIAYRSNMNGPHIQLQPFPITGAFYNVEGRGGSYPVWAGIDRLIYRRNVANVNVEDALPGELVIVDVTTNGSPRFGSERSLPASGILIFFGSRDYDIALNGTRLLGVFPEKLEHAAAGPRPQINITVNWVEEMKKRLAAP